MTQFSQMFKNENICKIPSKANLVHFPKTMRNEVLYIRSTPMRYDKTATIIIATISKGYTSDMFEDDVKKICKIFKLEAEDSKLVQKIALKPIEGVYEKPTEQSLEVEDDNQDQMPGLDKDQMPGLDQDPMPFLKNFKKILKDPMPFSNINKMLKDEDANDNLKEVLDSEDAREKITKAVEYISKGSLIWDPDSNDPMGFPADHSEFGIESTTSTSDPNIKRSPGLRFLRIVSVGVGYTKFLFKALEFLLNEWKSPVETKCVQFILRCDTQSRKFISFWESACIKRLCSWAEFVDLSEYLPFGHYKGVCNKWENDTNKCEDEKRCEDEKKCKDENKNI